jgi:pentatricopeptide repeat domain-containing protein 1
VAESCERSVITYSSLISALEKGGRWQLALDLYRRMQADGIKANAAIYNSAMSACAQGPLLTIIAAVWLPEIASLKEGV